MKPIPKYIKSLGRTTSKHVKKELKEKKKKIENKEKIFTFIPKQSL